VRIESVQHATDQASTVAQVLTGHPQPYAATPWFWSNQYDLRLQTVGLATGFDDFVVRGNPTARSFSVIYLRDGRVIAFDCVNAPKDYVVGGKLVKLGTRVPREALGDLGLPLRDLLPAQAVRAVGC
jgi:3-phenylpropionate/trans-cinnamate dioxygenase ferredoxin reductase subunit